MPAKLDILFVSEQPIWPLDQGFRVHGCNMVRSLVARGLRIGVASIHPPPDDLPDDLRAIHLDWPVVRPGQQRAFAARWQGYGQTLRHRLARHQGLDIEQLAPVRALVERHRPQAVIGLGQHAPMILRGLDPTVTRIWYAADEPVYFQLSCLRHMGLHRKMFAELRDRSRAIALYALIEQLFVRDLDGAIGVSPADTRLLRRIGGARHAITIPNGVDLDYFAPDESVPEPRSLIFWGRMDFEPNIDAVCWFARHVWPQLKRHSPQAVWRIVGKHPVLRVRELNAIDGIEVTGAVDDVRPYARQAALTILPMRCGGGIKNKLLEAAAMGLPIVASPRAVRGLALGDTHPVVVCRDAHAWYEAVRRLWQDAVETSRLRTAARQWVTQRHTWEGAAVRLLRFLDDLGCWRDKIAPDDETTTPIVPTNLTA